MRAVLAARVKIVPPPRRRAAQETYLKYGLGGAFIGDYTDIAVGSDNTFHAFWTDTNNVQAVDWFYGFEFAAGTMTNQQDVVVFSGSF